jgi:formate dehydrogenase alpha subunit
MKSAALTPSPVMPLLSDLIGESTMNSQIETITISIDNQPLRVKAGTTILSAARQSDIYIPTLCDHKELTPFGGCRMCIVEVDGMRGFPTACTTPVIEGMIIRTNTVQVQSIRSEILQLILSEHPSSCLICDEQDECKEFSGTIRKAGVTTGCRYCPNDGQCELAEVVKTVGVKEINYPIGYRYLPIEKEDPFYDRDYNLCILCGRCVRMCQEIRAANTLTFKQRGRQTIIGPAFSRTHIEAGCEFCGACISVCPTGALSEKTRKWLGKAESEQTTTCALCGVGCQILLQIKDNEVITVLPKEDPLINNGQLCVKGRFCIPELVNDYRRLKKSYQVHNELKAEISLEHAIEVAAENLSACPPDQFGMIVSQNCTNEDLYVAQKFTRTVMGSNNIDTMARVYYGENFKNYLHLATKSSSLEYLRQADAILCIGLDTRLGRSVVGVELRRAYKRGAKIISINSRPHNLPIIADKWLKPEIGREFDLIQSLAHMTENGNIPKMKPPSDEIASAAETLINAPTTVILIGSDIFRYPNSAEIFKAVDELANNIHAGIMLLPVQNNFFGTLAMGTYPELLPGGLSLASAENRDRLGKIWNTKIPDISDSWNASFLSNGKAMKILYFIGDIPMKNRPTADFVISQNIYPPKTTQIADLIIPAAAFTEIDGTFINGEGRLQSVRKGVEPPVNALPDWKILSHIAQKMGKEGFDYSTAEDIQKEISHSLSEFGNLNDERRDIIPLGSISEFMTNPQNNHGKVSANREYPFLLQTTAIEHTYRGFPLSTYVDGLKNLLAENLLEIGPDDARKLGLISGDEVIVTSADFEMIWPARVIDEQSPGILHVTLPQGEISGYNPYPVRIRKKNV